MDELIIGCPVYKRAWILPRWFESVERACGVAGIDPVYAFVVDDRDTETLDVIWDHSGSGYVFCVHEREEHEDVRNWNGERYAWMAELRNELLGVVRLAAPSYFLSLDSDILLHPDAIRNMMETIQSCDAVGGKAFLTELGTTCPNWANLSTGPSRSLKRHNVDHVIDVGILMAVKLMTPSAYSIDYEAHRQGEDIGWSLACAKKGLRFKWDGRVANKHVMRPDLIDKFDERVGF